MTQVRRIQPLTTRGRKPILGFTLLELLVVVAIIASATAAVSLSMRDSADTALERDALRLGAVLEAARAQSRASGVPVRWSATATGFVLEGLPGGSQPQAWLTPQTSASIDKPLWLGPEPIISPNTITLVATSRPGRVVRLVTDGVRPFAIQADASAAAQP